jgi:hypothetical protein
MKEGLVASAPPVLNKGLSLLVHGESKAGKSMIGISGRAPRCLLDVESAAHLLPIRAVIWDPDLPPPEPDGTWDTAVVQVNTWDDAVKAVNALHGQRHPFKSLSVDSISELQNKCIESIAGLQQVKLQDWGTALRLMRNFCNQLRDLTKHPNFPLNSVVVTSMSKFNEDTKKWEPYLQGQMKSVLPYIFDVNSFLIKEEQNVQGNWEVVRSLYTEPSNEALVKFTAGSRISGRVENPYVLDVIVGDTLEDIAKANVTVRRLVQSAFSLNPGTMPKPKAMPVTPVTTAPSTEQGAA